MVRGEMGLKYLRMHHIGLGLALLAVVMAPGPAFSQGGTDEQARKYLVRGMAAIEMAKSDDDLGLAAEEFRKATEIAPNMAAAWYNLGKVQAKTGQLKEAIDSFNRYLALAPQAEDAAKVRDEVTKLEFKLEQRDKFQSLSGQWVTSDGDIAIVTATPGRLTIDAPLRIPGEYDYYLKDPIAGNHRDASPVYSPNILELVQKGSQFTGIFETGAYRPGLVCSAPPQKSEVVGTVAKDRIVFKLQRTKFTVTEKFNGLLSTEVSCVEVQPTGTMNVEMVLRPLPAGGILRSAAGLEERDEIVSVNGAVLTELNHVERVMKLRGKPGTSARLVVKRLVEPAGIFSSAKYADIDLTVPYVEVNPATKGWLGIEMQAITPELAKSIGNREAKGIYVTSVVGSSPADKGGVKSGDIIEAVDGSPIQDPAVLVLYVNGTPAGRNVGLKLLRNGKPEELTVTIESRGNETDTDLRKRLAHFYCW